MEKIQYNFVTRVYNINARQNENHTHVTKAEAEIFRAKCSPLEYMKPTIYPKALFLQLFGSLT